MTSPATAARLLLEVAPADYIAERTLLVKQAKVDGDKAHSAFLKTLKRPTIAMWAVLAAGADAIAVHRAIEATTALAVVQANGGDGAAVAEAVGRRRATVGSLVESGITELARWDIEGRPRRDEIRDIVAQLVRRPDLADGWINGSLRDLPQHAQGFDAFADLDVPWRLHVVPTSPDSSPASVVPGSAPVDELAVRRNAARKDAQSDVEDDYFAKRDRVRLERDDRDRVELARLERELAERVALREKARTAVESAEVELHDVDERLGAAYVVQRSADESVQAAEADQLAARRRHKEAVARLESLDDSDGTSK